jgi:signal transduction histidine kinase
MFKSARYFFLVFIITTVIPLVLMFVWTSKRMEMMHKDKQDHFLSIGAHQLANLTGMYLDVQEGKVLSKTQNLSPDVSLDYLQKLFPDSQVRFVRYAGRKEVLSYYLRSDKTPKNSPDIYSSVIVPFYGNSKHGIQVTQKVDLTQIRPFGPFYMEIYAGDKVNKDSFIAEMPLPKMPPPPDVLEKEHRHHKPTHIYEDANRSHSEVKLLDLQGKPALTLALKHCDEHHHHGPPPEEENTFGIIILLAGTTLSLLVGGYIHGNFIQPIVVLAKASKRVQNGDLSFEISTDVKQKAIQNTYRNFNKMIQGLNEKEELRKSFILNLTHDLRTPLIAQERSLSLIAHRFESLGLQDEFELSSSLEQNNKHLLRMVNLILESYSFDSEKIQLDMKSNDLSEIVDVCYEKLKPLALEKNTQLINSIPKNFPRIVVDETCMKRVFLNLVSNAIENIGNNGQIEISARMEDGFAKILIEDNGCGISPKDLLHIFDRYYSGKSLERKLGSGLGLDVCKKLIEMHNGQISVESELNNYTRFTVQLPAGGEK